MHFYSYQDYLKKTFGKKVYKVVVSSHLTCPTRDGTLTKDGCAFCDVRGSSSFYGKKGRGNDVISQLTNRMPPIRERFHAEGFLAYFQSYTNTYGETPYLKEIYDSALSVEGVLGLCVGTRPDCLPDDVIDLLENLAQTHYVSLELGVQSFDEPTLLWLDRGHTATASIEALKRLKTRAPNVKTCVHLMFGSPTEPDTLYAESAKILNGLGVEGVKLHQLMVLQNTKLADRFSETPFNTVSLERYTEMIGEFTQALSPDIYIERLYATATHPEECIAPTWSRERWRPHNFIREQWTRVGLKQGALSPVSMAIATARST